LGGLKSKPVLRSDRDEAKQRFRKKKGSKRKKLATNKGEREWKR